MKRLKTGGTNSADKAQNGAAPAFTTLGNIVITEGANGDFATGSGVTLILTAPSGWRFNAGAGSVSFAASANISAASIAVTSSNLIVTLTVGNVNKTDQAAIQLAMDDLKAAGGNTQAARATLQGQLDALKAQHAQNEKALAGSHKAWQVPVPTDACGKVRKVQVTVKTDKDRELKGTLETPAGACG